MTPSPQPLARERAPSTLGGRRGASGPEATALPVDSASQSTPQRQDSARGPRPLGQPPAGDGLLLRVARGDATAVAECVATYGSLVWSIARRMALHAGDAEDAVQEIFIDLWKHAGRFDPAVASEPAFVTMIARRRSIDRRRRAQRRGETEEVHEHIPSREEPFDDRIARADEAEAARRAMAELRPEQREVLELSLGQGMTHVEIAEQLQMPLGTVKTHARRGLARVRELLERATGALRSPRL